jgi:phosphate transport system substrate-binding protein
MPTNNSVQHHLSNNEGLKTLYTCKMRKILYYFFLFALFIVSLSACTDQSDRKKITIAGSTTILPISEAWAAAFQSKTGVIVNVQGGGSTSGINLVEQGEADIGASSRNLSPTEEEGLTKIEIGKDALAVVVHPSNPVSNITLEQLRKIFTGQITNWHQLGGPDRIIQIINRESGSGTRTTFEELVICPQKTNCPGMTLSAIVLNSNSEVKRSVNLIPDSIGYVSFGFLDKNIKSLHLDGIEPTEAEIIAGHYPVYRSLYYLIKQSNRPEHLEQYLQFVKSSEAQSLLAKEGFLTINATPKLK